MALGKAAQQRTQSKTLARSSKGAAEVRQVLECAGAPALWRGGYNRFTISSLRSAGLLLGKCPVEPIQTALALTKIAVSLTGTVPFVGAIRLYVPATA